MLRVNNEGMPIWTYPVDLPVDVAGAPVGVALLEKAKVSKLTPDGARLWYVNLEGEPQVTAISASGRIAIGGTSPLFMSFAP